MSYERVECAECGATGWTDQDWGERCWACDRGYVYREIDPATCEHETVIRVKRVGDAWMQDFEDTPENWIREGRGHIVATVFCARCRQEA